METEPQTDNGWERIEPPTDREIEQYMVDLEQKGEMTELPCFYCESPIETPALPEMRGQSKETRTTICDECICEKLGDGKFQCLWNSETDG